MHQHYFAIFDPPGYHLRLMNKRESAQKSSTTATRKDLWLAALLFLAAGLVYLKSPVVQVADSHYTALSAHQFLHHGNFQLDAYFNHPRAASYPVQYSVLKVGGHDINNYPPGGIWLTLPFTAGFELAGVSPEARDGGYDADAEIKIQRLAAAFLSAISLAGLYFAARNWITAGTALTLALVMGFCTQIWSVTSRAMWQHTGVVLGATLAVWAISRAEGAGKRMPAAALATGVAWMYLSRPTSGLAVLLITGYVALRWRRSLFAYVCWGGAWAALLLCYSLTAYGTPLPSYYTYITRLLSFDRGFFLNLAGILISPSRGWFITVPIAAAIFLVVGVSWRRIKARAPVLLATLLICLQVLLLATFPGWTGGSSFGSRFTADFVPWLALLAMISFSPLTVAPRWLLMTAFIPAALCGAFINGRGALSFATWGWNRYMTTNPRPDDKRMWDWRYPQWMAGLIAPTAPAEPAPLALGEPLRLGDPASESFLMEGYGWSGPEGDFRRTDGTESLLAFGFASSAQEGRYQLTLRLQPFLVDRLVPRQRVWVSLNNRPMADLIFLETGIHEVVIPLPPGAIASRNVLSFRLPDAKAPAKLGISPDPRRFALMVYEIRVEERPPSPQ
jgi:hypothetical protein